MNMRKSRRERGLPWPQSQQARIALDFQQSCGARSRPRTDRESGCRRGEFSGGVMKKFGLDYASVAATNPR